MARIGVRDLYVFEIEEETREDVEYKESVNIADLIEVQVTPQTDSNELYADDRLAESISSLTSYDITLNVKDLSPEHQALLLGQDINDAGMVFSSADLNPPAFGVSFKAERSDGTFEFRQMFKVKFAPSDSTYNTKGESVDFQTATVTGVAMPLQHNRLFDTRVIGDEANEDITTRWTEEMFTEIDVVGG